METSQGNQDPTMPAIERVARTMNGAIGFAALSGTHVEVPHSFKDLVLPPDIHELLENGLSDAGMHGAATRKFFVNGHPKLLARQTAGAEMDSTVKAMHAARLLGIPMPPTSLIEHGGETYHITQIIQGTCLEDLLPNPSPELLAAVDVTWEKLNQSFMESFQSGLLWPIDIEGPNQFMWGTIPGGDHPRLWLSDLPDRYNQLKREEEYGYELFYMIEALCDIEKTTGMWLEKTRAALAEAIILCPDYDRHGDGLRNAAWHCFEHPEDIYKVSEEEDFIALHRTN